MRDILIEHFSLTEEDCKQRTKGGSAYQLDDRIGWVRQWLRRALFIEIPQKGVYRITQRGKDYLKSHSDLRQTDLMEYPEYAEYAGQSQEKYMIEFNVGVSTRKTYEVRRIDTD